MQKESMHHLYFCRYIFLSMNTTDTYTERSRMPQWVFYLIALQTATLSIVLWSQDGMKGVFIALALMVPVAVLLATAGIRLEFNPDVLLYKGTPFPFRKKMLLWEDAEKISIIKIDPMTDFWGWGYKKSAKYGWGHIYDSDTALFIERKDGSRITFSLKDSVAVRNFLKQHGIPLSE